MTLRLSLDKSLNKCPLIVSDCTKFRFKIHVFSSGISACSAPWAERSGSDHSSSSSWLGLHSEGVLTGIQAPLPAFKSRTIHTKPTTRPRLKFRDQPLPPGIRNHHCLPLTQQAFFVLGPSQSSSRGQPQAAKLGRIVYWLLRKKPGKRSKS